jgi:hypothetical protein
MKAKCVLDARHDPGRDDAEPGADALDRDRSHLFSLGPATDLS